MRKNKIKVSDYESKNGIEKLERDGHSRESIMKTMYRKTDGMNVVQRRKLMQEFFNRRAK